MGRLQDIVAGNPRDQMMGHSGDIPGTLVILFLKIKLTNILNLL